MSRAAVRTERTVLAQAKPSDRRLTNRDARPGLPAQAPSSASSALPCGLASPQNHGGEAARAPPSQIRALRLRSAGSGLGLQVPSHTPPPHTRCLGPVNTSSWCERPVVWPRLRPGTSRGEHATPANASRATRRPLRLLPSAACRGSVYGDDVQSGRSAAAAQRLSPHRPLCRDLCSVGLARGPLESDFVYLLWSAPAPHQPSPAGATRWLPSTPNREGETPARKNGKNWASGHRGGARHCPAAPARNTIPLRQPQTHRPPTQRESKRGGKRLTPGTAKLRRRN